MTSKKQKSKNAKIKQKPQIINEKDTLVEDIVQFDTIPAQTPIPPSVQGEQSLSGDMTDPESDDDTLENAHLAGFQTDEDLEHPKELDMGRDIDKAEHYVRTH